MHGGAAGSGAPKGNRNAFQYGLYTAEAIAERRLADDGRVDSSPVRVDHEQTLDHVALLLPLCLLGVRSEAVQLIQPPEPFMSLSIFVSYSHEDADLVGPVVRLLRATDDFVFLEVDSIRPGRA